MPGFRTMDKKCGVCGHIFETHIMMSPNAFGSPDLDLRPPQMKRSTMPMWIDKCPKCGYIHAEIEKDGRRHKAYIKSKEYITCDKERVSNELGRDFYKYGLILLKDGETLEAYDAFLHAAWASDDAGDDYGAHCCRCKAISLYDSRLFEENQNLLLRHMDLLRRTGHFKETILFGRTMKFEDELMQKVSQFQSERAEARDADCYRVEDCGSVFMFLKDEPFRLMRSGKKSIEVRCNDEKRQALNVGDKIIFRRTSNTDDKIYAEVAELARFDSFEELYAAYPSDLFGYEDRSVEEFMADVDAIYSKEKQEQYGALAITLNLHPRSIYGS